VTLLTAFNSYKKTSEFAKHNRAVEDALAETRQHAIYQNNEHEIEISNSYVRISTIASVESECSGAAKKIQQLGKSTVTLRKQIEQADNRSALTAGVQAANSLIDDFKSVRNTLESFVAHVKSSSFKKVAEAALGALEIVKAESRTFINALTSALAAASTRIASAAPSQEAESSELPAAKKQKPEPTVKNPSKEEE